MRLWQPNLCSPAHIFNDCNAPTPFEFFGQRHWIWPVMCFVMYGSFYNGAKGFRQTGIFKDFSTIFCYCGVADVSDEWPNLKVFDEVALLVWLSLWLLIIKSWLRMFNVYGLIRADTFLIQAHFQLRHVVIDEPSLTSHIVWSHRWVT